MALELGDHVWYWNGLISMDKNIPRLQWFPHASPTDTNDYCGHGKEIFHYVIHADEIARGRPHMKNYEGTFAWLNNNPGNINGAPGGTDWGQYQGKFCYHNFLIFPTWADGYDAIRKVLRTDRFVHLSILEAFKTYAPESDGNNPVAYANAVAVALGVPVSTVIADLDDEQMLVVQDSVQRMEGAIAGASLSWDSDEVPVEIAELLPLSARKFARPRALPQARSPFVLDMSAPVDVSGFTQGLGGPGDHPQVPPNWYINFGMDIGGAQGTSVYAAFEGHVTRFTPHNPATDQGKIYGAQIFMRSPNDRMGAFYTHLTDVPDWIGPNAVISRGDFLGTVHKFGAISPHLHMALVEIVDGQYLGFDLYQFFLNLQTEDPSTVVPIQFWQDGTPPEPLWRGAQLGALSAPGLRRPAEPGFGAACAPGVPEVSEASDDPRYTAGTVGAS